MRSVNNLLIVWYFPYQSRCDARARFAARATRVFTVLRIQGTPPCRSRGRARTSVGTTRLRLVEPPLQALKNAPLAAFFTHATCAPLANARGESKNPRLPRRSKGYPHPRHQWSVPMLFSLREPVLLRGRRRVFLAGGPEHQRGVRRRPGNEREAKPGVA
jgi:hypothetical protein